MAVWPYFNSVKNNQQGRDLGQLVADHHHLPNLSHLQSNRCDTVFLLLSTILCTQEWTCCSLSQKVICMHRHSQYQRCLVQD